MLSFEAIEIQVEHRSRVTRKPASVLVNDWEGGAADLFGGARAKALYDSLGERGLARAQVAFEQQNLARVGSRPMRRPRSSIASSLAATRISVGSRGNMASCIPIVLYADATALNAAGRNSSRSVATRQASPLLAAPKSPASPCR